MNHLVEYPWPRKGDPQSTTLAIAPRGSGKTTFVVDFLNRSRGLYQAVHYLCPSIDHDAKTSAALREYKKTLYRDGPVRYREAPLISTYMEPESWPGAVQMLSNRSASDAHHRVLFVADDVAWDKRFLKSPELTRLFLNARHVNVDVLVCLQYYRLAPPALRMNATRVLLWSMPSVNILKDIAEEFPIRDPETGQILSKKEWLRRYHTITSKRYQKMVLAC